MELELADLSPNVQLMSWRKSAIHSFHKLYAKAIRKGRKKQLAINGASTWINQQMGKTVNWQTMDNLDIQECQQLIDIIEPHVKQYR